jgi:hypothetical protein
MKIAALKASTFTKKSIIYSPFIQISGKPAVSILYPKLRSLLSRASSKTCCRPLGQGTGPYKSYHDADYQDGDTPRPQYVVTAQVGQHTKQKQ